MTPEDFIITVFCEIDDQLGPLPQPPQAILWPSELVPIGVLFALKGGPFRAFERWLRRDYASHFEPCPSALAPLYGRPPGLGSALSRAPVPVYRH